MERLKPNDEPALRFGNDVGEAILPLMAGSSVQIVGVRDDAFQRQGNLVVVRGDRLVTQMGTGTLVRIEDCHFMVTASHVFDKIDEFGLGASIPVGDPAVPMPLRGRLCQSEKPLDVAVFLLDQSLVEGLKDKKYLTLPRIEFRNDLGDGWFFLRGFPSVDSYTSKDLLAMTQKAFNYRTSRHRGRTSSLAGYEPDVHLLLDMGGETRFADDLTPTELPKSLGGISGSSIWLGYSERDFAGEWTPDRAKVVAVQTCVYTDNKVIRGTRWAGVAVVIWDNFPELHEALAKHLPAEVVDQLTRRPVVRHI
jgi:hypothetical protein